MIGSDRPPAALAEHTGFLMNWVALRSRERFARELAERFDLHPREYGVLAVIAAEQGITQQAIGDAANVDPSTMVATLDALERRGLAERRPHASDRRKRAVYLTPEGERVWRGARSLGRDLGDEVFAALSAAERKQLHAILRKLSGLDPA